MADNVHLEIHALRRISGYKPSMAEKNISRFVIETYKDCKECQAIKEQLKNAQPDTSLLKKIGKIINDN